MNNQTLNDDFLQDLGKVTLNSAYLPQRSEIRVSKKLSQIDTPPDYLPALIVVKWGSLSDKEKVVIPLLFANSLSESLQANFITESPIGSTYPIIAFSHTSPSSIPISFTILSDYLPSNYQSMEHLLRDIRSMVQPKYSGDIVHAPRVEVSFSNIYFKGVCDSINIEYDTTVYGDHTLVKATINCNFIVQSRS